MGHKGVLYRRGNLFQSFDVDHGYCIGSTRPACIPQCAFDHHGSCIPVVKSAVFVPDSFFSQGKLNFFLLGYIAGEFNGMNLFALIFIRENDMVFLPPDHSELISGPKLHGNIPDSFDSRRYQ